MARIDLPGRRPARAALGRRLALVAALTAGTPMTAAAQYAACRPPLKEAAGACVAQCPAGYADTGRACEYRNTSR